MEHVPELNPLFLHFPEFITDSLVLVLQLLPSTLPLPNLISQLLIFNHLVNLLCQELLNNFRILCRIKPIYNNRIFPDLQLIVIPVPIECLDLVILPGSTLFLVHVDLQVLEQNVEDEGPEGDPNVVEPTLVHLIALLDVY